MNNQKNAVKLIKLVVWWMYGDGEKLVKRVEQIPAHKEEYFKSLLYRAKNISAFHFIPDFSTSIGRSKLSEEEMYDYQFLLNRIPEYNGYLSSGDVYVHDFFFEEK